MRRRPSGHASQGQQVLRQGRFRDRLLRPARALSAGPQFGDRPLPIRQAAAGQRPKVLNIN